MFEVLALSNLNIFRKAVPFFLVFPSAYTSPIYSPYGSFSPYVGLARIPPKVSLYVTNSFSFLSLTTSYSSIWSWDLTFAISRLAVISYCSSYLTWPLKSIIYFSLTLTNCYFSSSIYWFLSYKSNSSSRISDILFSC